MILYRCIRTKEIGVTTEPYHDRAYRFAFEGGRYYYACDESGPYFIKCPPLKKLSEEEKKTEDFEAEEFSIPPLSSLHGISTADALESAARELLDWLRSAEAKRLRFGEPPRSETYPPSFRYVTALVIARQRYSILKSTASEFGWMISTLSQIEEAIKSMEAGHGPVPVPHDNRNTSKDDTLSQAECMRMLGKAITLPDKNGKPRLYQVSATFMNRLIERKELNAVNADNGKRRICAKSFFDFVRKYGLDYTGTDYW